MSSERRDTTSTAYTAATPWLIWDKWSKGQCYKTANPPWFKQFTSLWTDPACRAVWDVPGEADGRAALIFRLTQHMAVHSAIGAVWGDPVALQRELRMDRPPDLEWLLAAGWLRYITDDEKIEREQALAERGRRAAASKSTAPTGKNAKRKTRGEERRGEERRGEDSHSDSDSVRDGSARNKSIRVNPKAQKSKREPKAKPQAQQRPQEPAGSPKSPKEPEGGGRMPKSPGRRTAAPRASSVRRRGDAVPLGACLPRLHWDDPAAVDFGRRLVETLWPGRDMGTQDAQSEVGCFAKFYIQQRARSPTGVGNGFVDDCMAKARHIARYGKTARSKGAVLLKILRDKGG